MIISIATWSLARRIVATNNQIISREEIVEKLPDDKKEKLRRAKLFSFEWIEHYVAFQSTLVYSYFKIVLKKVRQTPTHIAKEKQRQTKFCDPYWLSYLLLLYA